MHRFSFYSCDTARNQMLQAVAITSIITIASGNLPRILIATCFLCFHVASILKGIKICVFYHFSLRLLVLMTMTQICMVCNTCDKIILSTIFLHAIGFLECADYIQNVNHPYFPAFPCFQWITCIHPKICVTVLKPVSTDVVQV